MQPQRTLGPDVSFRYRAENRKKLPAQSTKFSPSPNLQLDTATAHVLLGMLVFAAAVTTVSAAPACEPPRGTYLQTCKAKGAVYTSTDPNLSSIRLCAITLSCEDLKGALQETQFYIPERLRNCMTFFENCNGQAVVRTDDKQHCTTAKKAQEDGMRSVHLEV